MKRTIGALYSGVILLAGVCITTPIAAVSAQVRCAADSAQQMLVGVPHKLTVSVDEEVRTSIKDKATLKLTSSSDGAVFLKDANDTQTITELDIVAEKAEYAIYYKATADGQHTITLEQQASADNQAAPLKTSCDVTVKAATDTTDSAATKPLLFSLEEVQTYTDAKTKLVLHGSVENVPDSARVVMRLLSGKKIIAEKEVEARGKDRELVSFDATTALKDGVYTAEMVLFLRDSFIIQAVSTPVRVMLSTAPDLHNPKNPPATQPIDTQPLTPLPPVKDARLSVDFSVPYSAKVASARIAAPLRRQAATPSGMAVEAAKPAVVDSEAQPEEYSLAMEKARPVTLSVPEQQPHTPEEAPIRFLGIDWYWWGAGVGTVGLIWLGARKLLG